MLASGKEGEEVAAGLGGRSLSANGNSGEVKKDLGFYLVFFLPISIFYIGIWDGLIVSRPGSV